MVVGYNFLLKEFVSISSREHLTPGEIARRMKMSPSALKNFLEIMEVNGDLKSCGPEGAGEKAEKGALKCTGCSAAGCCQAASCTLKGKTYRITEKARKACAGGG